MPINQQWHHSVTAYLEVQLLKKWLLNWRQIKEWSENTDIFTEKKWFFFLPTHPSSWFNILWGLPTLTPTWTVSL